MPNLKLYLRVAVYPYPSTAEACTSKYLLTPVAILAIMPLKASNGRVIIPYLSSSSFVVSALTAPRLQYLLAVLYYLSKYQSTAPA